MDGEALLMRSRRGAALLLGWVWVVCGAGVDYSGRL